MLLDLSMVSLMAAVTVLVFFFMSLLIRLMMSGDGMTSVLLLAPGKCDGIADLMLPLSAAWAPSVFPLTGEPLGEMLAWRTFLSSDSSWLLSLLPLADLLSLRSEDAK